MKRVFGYLCVVSIALIAVPVLAAGPGSTGFQATHPNGTRAAEGTLATLYSQLGNPTTSGMRCQDFETVYDAYDAEGGDDFNVTWPDGWSIEQVHLPGFDTGSEVAQFANVAIYSDGGTSPGAAVCAGTASIANTDGDIMATLNTPCFVPQGNGYWVGASVRIDYLPSGSGWFWFRESAVTYDQGNWINPGQGFTGSTGLWTPLSGVVSQYFDFAFEILGTEQVGPTNTPDPNAGGNPIPTLGRTGVVLMVVLLVGVAVALLYRRS